MTISRLLHISRPRFWLYEAGTYSIGVAAAYAHGYVSAAYMVPAFAFLLYFAFPANLYIYGINDIFDYDTDRLNPKKTEYEALVEPVERPALWRAIGISTVPFLLFLFAAPRISLIAFFAFLFFAAFYSAPPIRAKTLPLLDSLFSAGHYVATGAFAYLLVGGAHLSAIALFEAMAWATAMHAYSAVPDIGADAASGIRTVATIFGKHETILLCTALYVIAGLFSFHYLGWISLLLSGVYVTLMILSYRSKTDAELFSLYTIFPYVNALSGMALFFVALLR